ncbi:MAG: apolipoprotein N-acyltransferase [Paracoccus sp. (in: a-proteobacteria)]
MSALGQAPWGLWPLSILALAVLTLRISRTGSPRQAAWHGLIAGMGYFALALSWIVEPFYVDPVFAWMAPFALILTALGGGLFWAVPAWLAARIAPDPQGRAVSLAAGLVISDWLRGWIFTGFPWALLGHVWIDTPAAQAAAFIGAVGLSALTAFAAALPAIFWQRPGYWRGALPGTALSLLLIAVFWTGGQSRLDTPIHYRDITLRLVQPNAAQELKWDPEWAPIFWQRLLDESAAPADGPAPDAVIWPETAVNFLLDQGSEAWPIISEATGTPVLMGIQRRDGSRFYNSLIELSPGGEVIETYDKFHLVPFGEYSPWGDTFARFGISAFASQLGFGFSSGPGPEVMSLQSLPPVQPLICYEAIFPQHLRASEGAEWLVQITNDAWFGTRSGPYQHLAQARLRAIESGLPLLRAANTGITAAMDPLGRITASLPLEITGHLDASLAAPLPGTVWTRLGPWPVLVSAFALILGCFARRHGRDASGGDI